MIQIQFSQIKQNSGAFVKYAIYICITYSIIIISIVSNFLELTIHAKNPVYLQAKTNP